MLGKKHLVTAALVAMLGLVPCAAFADDAISLSDDAIQPTAEVIEVTDVAADGESELVAQASKNIYDCTIKFTDSQHGGKATDWWQMYYVKGKNTAAKPKFSLYYNGKKVAASKYTVQYRLTWWDESTSKEKSKLWKKALVPSASPEATKSLMGSEYRVVIKAKKGSGFTGTFSDAATVCVVDSYSIGHYMDFSFSKAKKSWRYNINPMNPNYYVIPKAKAKKVLNSLTLKTGVTERSKGTKVAKKYYTVTYYKAKRKAATDEQGKATTGKALKSMPTTAGSYVVYLKAKKPYYGGGEVMLFDIQDKMSNVKVKSIAKQKYTGSEVTPKLKVTYKGTTLKENVDYTVTYKNNTEKGTATATITGCNPVYTNTDGKPTAVNKQRFFSGSKTVKFTIA